MSKQAKFLVVESADAGALEDLAEGLYRWLHEKGVPAERTGEPTRGPVGALVRLADQGRLRVDPAALALLHVADRLDHLNAPGGIQAALEEGRTLLCAGYMLASLASLWGEVDPAWWAQIHARCRVPDLTLYLEGGDPSSVREAKYAQAVERLRALGHEIAVVDGTRPGEALARCRARVSQILF